MCSVNRRNSIDVLRVISAIAVVTIHIVTAPVGNAAEDIKISTLEILNLIHNLMLWAVPVFFMITGYCLMKKEECGYRYCLKHVLKYTIVLFTVGLGYALMEQLFCNRSFSFGIVGAAFLNVIRGNLWAHMWFVYAIIGIYLVMPLLHSFIKYREKEFYILTLLLFVFTIVLPSFKQFFQVGIQFPLGGYLFYVCYGGVIAKYKSDREKEKIQYFLGVIAFLYVICCGKIVTLEYMDVNIALIAMAIFTFIEGLNIKVRNLIKVIAECTWGIYLIHPIFINIALKFLKLELLSALPYIKLVLFELIILFISFSLTFVLRKIPFLKKIF